MPREKPPPQPIHIEAWNFVELFFMCACEVNPMEGPFSIENGNIIFLI